MIPHRLIRATTLCLAISCMAISSSTASANTLALSAESFSYEWEAAALSSGAGGAGLVVSCPLTMEGSFHEATIAKELEELIGHVTNASFDEPNCFGGDLIVLTGTLPWHLTYQGYSGTLPEIDTLSVAIHGQAIRMFIPSIIHCLYADTGANPLRGIANVSGGGQITTLTADSDAAIPGAPGNPILCPSSIYFNGTSLVSEGGGELLFLELT